MATRPTEGAYSALLAFDNGAFAHATYSTYAHYDSDELMAALEACFAILESARTRRGVELKLRVRADRR